MTVAVLSPQDPLKESNRYSKQSLISPPPNMKYPRNTNPNFNRIQPTRRKRSPPRSQNTSPPSSRAAVTTKLPAKNNLVMGQVKILKRGEELAALKPIQAPEPEKKKVGDQLTVQTPQKKEEVAVTKPIHAPEPEKKKAVEKKVIVKRVDFDLGSTNRLGPDPKSVPVQIRSFAESKTVAPFYAGSAFFTSPPPSSVPLPAFFTKTKSVVDDATSDLRRILKLDIL